MSKFFSSKHKGLVSYTPGEQPKVSNLIKLNTNESPFAPSDAVAKTVYDTVKRLNLYSDPTASDLHKKIAEVLGVNENQVLATNGSDEILNFAFMAFCDDEHPVVFPDITYGFYPVFARLNGIEFEEIPLNDDFTINVDDYIGINKNIFIANPNAPTGIALSLNDIERIVASNPDNIVVIDEAYVDFGAESAVKLIDKYDNLLVTQTFSKSRSFAGARLGFGVACESLINDLNTIKYSTNPYNVNSLTMSAGIKILEEEDTTRKNCEQIIKNREYTICGLKELGFTCTNSSANFIFASHSKYSGKYIYEKLRECNILVRHFDKERINDYNRITVGTKEQMDKLLAALKNII